MCHMSIPYMPEDSHIINLASNSSWQPVPYINVYGASKAYVMSFSRALGVELKKQGMHVRAVKLLPVSLVMKTWCRQQGK